MNDAARMKGIIMVLTDRYFKFISVILISLVLEGSTCDSHPKIYDFKTARMLVPTMTASTPTKSWTLASHGFTGESLLASTTTDQLWLWLLLILTATASIEEQSQQR
nr:uncharacterized protein LOC117841660 [Setaria viridis]